MVKALQLALLTVIACSSYCRADTVKEPDMDFGNTCVKAPEPLTCMESYGFFCHRSGLPDRSVGAQSLGCNLDLGNGRYRFVQMLYDNGEWNVQIERTYVPESAELRLPEEDSTLALSSYIEQKMEDYSSHISGGGQSNSGLPQEFATGARREDGRIAVRAACGAVINVEIDESVSEQLMSDCERYLLRTVKKLSQAQGDSSYRVAAPSEFEWEKHFASLVSGDSAWVLEGRYTFAEAHTPCLWISDCCSREGGIYLDSCRAPTKPELQVIQTCLHQVESRRSDEFADCLRTSGVNAGCEVQDDGSRICF